MKLKNKKSEKWKMEEIGERERERERKWKKATFFFFFLRRERSSSGGCGERKSRRDKVGEREKKKVGER